MANIELFIAEREKGQFPVSIATSLALESLAGIHPDIPNVVVPPIKETRLLMFNIRTLIRNIHGALSTDVKRKLTAKVCVKALIEEMSIIEASVNRISEGMVPVVFYACAYGSLSRKFPHAHMRPVVTELQLEYTHMERDTIRELLAMQPAFDIRRYDVDITDKFTDTFIVTHHAVDLLSKKQFEKLTLLETHTGAIKNHLLWNTKLTKGKDNPRIPFCAFSLQVFGDNGHLFSPMDAKTRAAVLSIAENDNWTAASTRDRIIESLRKLSDMELKTKLLMLV